MIRWANYSNGKLKEGVSLTIHDELNRWQGISLAFHFILFWTLPQPLYQPPPRFIIRVKPIRTEPSVKTPRCLTHIFQPRAQCSLPSQAAAYVTIAYDILCKLVFHFHPLVRTTTQPRSYSATDDLSAANLVCHTGGTPPPRIRHQLLATGLFKITLKKKLIPTKSLVVCVCTLSKCPVRPIPASPDMHQQLRMHPRPHLAVVYQ